MICCEKNDVEDDLIYWLKLLLSESDVFLLELSCLEQTTVLDTLPEWVSVEELEIEEQLSICFDFNDSLIDKENCLL